MDTFDIIALSGLIGYALGYVHKTFCVDKKEEMSPQEHFNDAVGRCAFFGLLIMEEGIGDANKLECLLEIEEQMVSVVVAKVNEVSE